MPNVSSFILIILILILGYYIYINIGTSNHFPVPEGFQDQSRTSYTVISSQAVNSIIQDRITSFHERYQSDRRATQDNIGNRNGSKYIVALYRNDRNRNLIKLDREAIAANLSGANRGVVKKTINQPPSFRADWECKQRPACLRNAM